jgi:hypothetical protein
MTDDKILQLSSKEIIETFGAIEKTFGHLQTQGKFATGQTIAESKNPYKEDIKLFFPSASLSYFQSLINDNAKYRQNTQFYCVPSPTIHELNRGNISLSILSSSIQGKRNLYLNISLTLHQKKTQFLILENYTLKECIEYFKLLILDTTESKKMLFTLIAGTIATESGFNHPFHNFQNPDKKHTPVSEIGQLTVRNEKLVFVSNAKTQSDIEKAKAKARDSFLWQMAKKIASGEKVYSANDFTKEENTILKYRLLHLMKNETRKIEELKQKIRENENKKK